jgi:hypothetical protein
LLGLFVLFAAYWLVIGRPVALKRANQQVTAEKTVAEAAVGAARSGLDITVSTQETIRQIDLQTTRNTHEILTAPGATNTVDPELHRRGLVALCMRNGRADDPVCADLLHRDGEGVEAGPADTPR